MLLLHGLGGCTIHWELVAPALARRLSAEVTAIDLPGFGLTRAPALSATLPIAGEVVFGLLDAEGTADLVGSSMGGALATAVAAERPDLVGRLVLVTPAVPQPQWPEPAHPLLPHNWPAAIPGVGPLAVSAYAESTTDEQVVDDRIRRSFLDPRRIDPGIRARLVALVRTRRGFDEAPHAYAAATRSLFWYVTDPAGMARDIARVQAPTDIIHGAEDRLIPLPLAQAAIRRRPDWRLVVLEDCGHLPQLEAPQRFVAAVASGDPGA
jgi:pimeloyl-ACP methyl ester carboxylesterase